MDEATRDAVLGGIVACWIQDAQADAAKIEDTVHAEMARLNRAEAEANRRGGWAAYWGK